MSEASGFSQVFARELEAINAARGPSEPRVSDDNLLGLALSGGGIRSATFNLGLIQGLAKLGLLKDFDYLSTVSGGGYIGSWLSAWVKHCDTGIAGVQDELRDPDREPDEVGHLRELSNYLTPKVGWLSSDTLAGVATYLRNLLLNLVLIVTVAAAVLMAPWLLEGIAVFDPEWLFWGSAFPLLVAAAFITANVLWQEIAQHPAAPSPAPPSGWRHDWPYMGLLLALAVVILVASFYFALPRPHGYLVRGLAILFIPLALAGVWVWSRKATDMATAAAVAPSWTHPWAVSVLIVVPLALWALAIGLALQLKPSLIAGAAWLLAAVSAASAFVIMAATCRLYSLRRYPRLAWRDSTARVLGQLAGALFGAALLLGFTEVIGLAGGAAWHTLVLGVPAILGIFLLSVTVMLGLTGRNESEYAREWWGRLGGVVLRVSLAWLLLGATAVYGPLLVIKLGEWAGAAGFAWIATTVWAVMAGKSAGTGPADSRRWLDVAVKLGPYVFIAGLLVAVASVAYFSLAALAGLPACVPPGASGTCTAGAYFDALSAVVRSFWLPCAAMAVVLLAWILSGAVDINLFSFHMFYRNRLARCYLGASNRKRSPLPFIEFDPRDSLTLAELKLRPFHIINTALNLTSSRRLAWQERKAGSFTMSPLYCGYELQGAGRSAETLRAYQPTREIGMPAPGLDLGTALSISGAAASPNMGYHSTPSVSFLLTVFNVRLGWWMQNPGRAGHWRAPGPVSALRYLASELFGMASEETPCVYLSDGGHFDNLGVYELVRRGCRFIVASDASADPKFQFHDLGDAIRKCHIDLGISIDIDTRAIVPGAGGLSPFHCAVGTIHYKDAAPGYLLYVKPSRCGGEPPDVSQYAKEKPAFPHEGTHDQWFSESQFESYRRLGLHIADAVFQGAYVSGPTDRESMFVHLKERWYPPSPAGREAFSRHGDQLRSLARRLSDNPLLSFLDAQVYPEWPDLTRAALPSPAAEANLWLPSTESELRAGFYFCIDMLQLLENVYLDLGLEDAHAHPDNRGWMNLFSHWAWSGMFMATYAVSCSMYGARFQRFCEKRIGLSPGTLELLSSPEAAMSGLNFVEKHLVGELRAAGLDFDRVHLLRMRVPGPVAKATQAADGEALVYTIGFAASQGTVLSYFRVQDHLRKMGHGRDALSKLYHGERLRDLDVERLRQVSKTRPELVGKADLESFERLFRSVARQPGDYADIKASMMKETARKEDSKAGGAVE